MDTQVGKFQSAAASVTTRPIETPSLYREPAWTAPPGAPVCADRSVSSLYPGWPHASPLYATKV